MLQVDVRSFRGARVEEVQALPGVLRIRHHLLLFAILASTEPAKALPRCKDFQPGLEGFEVPRRP